MVDIDALRQPEHTGQNRCWPCTVLNLLLVGVVSLWLLLRDRRVASVALTVVGVAAVALRGYVVPYTPTFAPRLLAATPIPERWFKQPLPDRERDSLTATDIDGETVLQELAGAGALTADGELIRPTESIDTAWREELDELATLSIEQLAERATERLPNITSAEPHDTGDTQWLVVGSGQGSLVARPVAVAEIAAYSVLEETLTDQQARLSAARALRMFLDNCPVCSTPLTESSEVSCCGGYTDPRESPDQLLVCPTCEQRLYTIPSG